jgi:hypothetical protein
VFLYLTDICQLSEDRELGPLNYLTDLLNYETNRVHNLGCLNLRVLGFVRFGLSKNM